MFLRSSKAKADAASKDCASDPAALKSLVYVSRTTIPSARRKAQLDSIIAVARARNSQLHVTGALISSAYTFAQYLEGPATTIDILMASICRDVRHRDVKIVSEELVSSRRFAAWSMAFSGNANYIDRHIEVLLDPAFYDADQMHVSQLQNLIAEFSKRIGH